MTVFDNIKIIAKQHGLTLGEINEKAGLGTRTIYRWSTNEPTLANLTKVAKVLHVSVNELLDTKNSGSDNNYTETNNKRGKAATDHQNGVSQIISIEHATNSNNFPEDEEPAEFGPTTYRVRIPVLGRIACGEPILAEQNIDCYRELSFSKKPEGTLFILKCKGKSMEPTIPDGAFVTIKVQPKVESGEMAAVLIGDEATVKRVEYHDNYIALNPDNRNYGTIKLNKENPGEILGKVVHMDVDF